MSFVVKAVKSVFKLIKTILTGPDEPKSVAQIQPVATPKPAEIELPPVRKEDTAAREKAAAEKKRRLRAATTARTILTGGRGIIGDDEEKLGGV